MKRIKQFIVVSFIIIAMVFVLQNCQKDVIIHNDHFQNNIPTKYLFKKVNYEDISKKILLIETLESIKNKLNEKINSNDGAFSILEDNIIETSYDSLTTYSFLIERPVANNTLFENFIIKETSQLEYSFYMVRYFSSEETESIFEIEMEELDDNLVTISDFNLKVVSSMDDCTTNIYNPCGCGGNADGHVPTPDYSCCQGSPLVGISVDWNCVASAGAGPGNNSDGPTGNGGGGGTVANPLDTADVTFGIVEATSFQLALELAELLGIDVFSSSWLQDTINNIGTQNLQELIDFINENPGDDEALTLANNAYILFLNHISTEIYDDNTSTSIDIDEYLDCFFNSSPSNFATYSISIYVDQPVQNSDDAWSLSLDGIDPGHTFLSLTINDGFSSVNQTIGFYPATSIDPVRGLITCPGEIIDDSEHYYDVSATVEVSQSIFFNILLFIKQTGTPNYNLDTFNCSDYGISIFNNVGVNLPDTTGLWIGGGGTNPGNLGQDLRTYVNPNVTINTSGGDAPISDGGGC